MRRLILLTLALGIAAAAACGGTPQISVRDNSGHTCEFVRLDGGILTCPTQPTLTTDGGPSCTAQGGTACWQLAVFGSQSSGSQTWTEYLCGACCIPGAGASYQIADCNPLICSDTIQCITYGVNCTGSSCTKTVTCNDAGGCL